MKLEPQREEALFQAAAQLTGPERAAFLEGACYGNPALHQRLEALLSAHEQPDTLLATQVEADRPTVKLDLADAPDEAVGQTLGRYKLLEKVGEGGCGVVYVAEQTEPVRRRVALKVIKLGMDTKQVVARFEAERQALAMMDHPNIAKVLDAGATDTGRPYFVMELVRGIRITDYCDQANLSTKNRLDLFIKVCQAIQHAHQKGIIHRDIKPSNILVTLHDGVPVPKVIDFGIAKATEGRLTDATVYTQLHQFIGTPAYMSPEQAEMSGLDIDTRSDVYSLGVLLYELLSGTTPFDAKELISSGIDAMRKTIREKEPVRPSTRFATLKGEELTTTARRRSADTSKLLHQLKGDLDCIVMKSLEKDRTRRYDTANGLAADLTRHLTNEPVLARPPTVGYAFQKAFRRNKLLFTAGATAAAALVLGIGLSTWQAIAAMRARTEAQRLLYVANMNLAQQAWEQNNIGRLRQLLDETVVYPGRGFEWYYWQRQAHLELKALRGHSNWINSVAFSPDGRRVLTGSNDSTARVWDAARGRELLTLKGPSSINSVAFSLDGQRIATGSYDRTARIWDAASGRELVTLKGHSAEINTIAFSPDGHLIVTGSSDQTAKVWDAASGRDLLTFKGHSARINSVAFSRDGQQIVTGSGEQTALVWDPANGRELLTLKGHFGPINSVAFSPDGQKIVTGSSDQTVRVWDAATGRELLALEWPGNWISSAVFSPDGQRVLAGSAGSTARVWDTGTGQELLTLKGHSAAINSVSFSPDGQQIVTGSVDQTAKLWDAVGRRAELALEGQSRAILSVAFSPDGPRVVTGGGDQTAKVWDATSGRELLTLAGHSNWINSVAFSPDGQRIATGSSDQTAKVWDAVRGRELLMLTGHSHFVTSVAFSPGGQRIVTGSADQTAKVWDAASGREIVTLKGHKGPISSAGFSPDGQRILTGSYETARIWDAASGRELRTLEWHGNWISVAAFSPDGQRVVTGSTGSRAKVWDAGSGRGLVTLKGHSSQIRSVVFSRDSQRVVTGSADQTAKVWDAASGRELLTLKGHGSHITSMAFSPDGQRLLTGSLDGMAKVWQAASAEQVAQWRKEEQATAESVVEQR